MCRGMCVCLCTFLHEHVYVCVLGGRVHMHLRPLAPPSPSCSPDSAQPRAPVVSLSQAPRPGMVLAHKERVTSFQPPGGHP